MKDKGKLWQFEEVVKLAEKLRPGWLKGSYSGWGWRKESYWVETPPNAFRKGKVVIHLPDYRKWHWIRRIAAKVLRKRLMKELPSEVVIEIKGEVILGK